MRPQIGDDPTAKLAVETPVAEAIHLLAPREIGISISVLLQHVLRSMNIFSRELPSSSISRFVRRLLYCLQVLVCFSVAFSFCGRGE